MPNPCNHITICLSNFPGAISKLFLIKLIRQQLRTIIKDRQIPNCYPVQSFFFSAFLINNYYECYKQKILHFNCLNRPAYLGEWVILWVREVL